MVRRSVFQSPASRVYFKLSHLPSFFLSDHKSDFRSYAIIIGNCHVPIWFSGVESASCIYISLMNSIMGTGTKALGPPR